PPEACPQANLDRQDRRNRPEPDQGAQAAVFGEGKQTTDFSLTYVELIVWPESACASLLLLELIMSAVMQADFSDYKAADIALADYGGREIVIAEAEMPALMAPRRKYKAEQPLKGARTLAGIRMTTQSAELI